MPSNLYAVQQHHVSQAAEAHQDPFRARGRDLRSVRALKTCNIVRLAAQPAYLTTAMYVATTQNPAEPATIATAIASHAALSSVVVPTAGEAPAQRPSQTEADAGVRAMGAKPASILLTPTADLAARMESLSDVDATKPAPQSAGAGSAGAESPPGSQSGPMQRSNGCKRRREEKAALGRLQWYARPLASSASRHSTRPSAEDR